MANGGVVVVVSAQDDTGKTLQAIDERFKHLSTSARESGSALGEFGERLKSALEYTGIYLGIREIVDGFKELVKGSVELGVELGHLSQQTGIGVEDLSVLKYMSEKTGIGFEDLTKSFRKFSVEILNAEEGKKQSIQTFERLGISQQEVRANSNDMLGLLGQVADRFQTMPDGPNKAAEAVALFGRSGLTMIPILNQGRDGIARFEAEARSLGVVLDAEGVEKMERLHAATVKLKGGLEGAGLAITAGLEPALTGLETALAGAVSGGNGFVEVGRKMGDMVLGAANSIAYLISFLRQADAEFKSLDSHVDHPFEKIDSYLGFTKGQRDRAAARAKADEQESQDAIKEYNDARSDYEKFANQLAGSLSQDKPDYIVGPGESKKQHAEEVARRKQLLRDLELQDQTGGKGKSAADALAAAQRELAQANDKLDAAQQKAVNDEQLAELEDQHKRLLVSDEDYYRQKAALQKSSLDAELAGNTNQQADIQAQIDKLNAHKLSGTDATERNAKVIELRAKMIDLQAQAVALGAKEVANAEALNSELAQAVLKRREETDALNVAAEQAAGAGVAARLKQSRDAYFGEGGERQKIALEHGDLTTADAVQQHKEDTISAQGADEGFQQASGYLNAQRAGVDAEASRGLITATQAQRRKIDLDREEADAMQPVLAAYEKLAEGGDLNAAEKVAELQEKIAELRNPVDEVAAHAREELGGAFEGVFENIQDGTKALQNFAKELERTAEKAVYDKLVKPGVDSLLDKVIPNQRTGAAGIASAVRPIFGDSGKGSIESLDDLFAHGISGSGAAPTADLPVAPPDAGGSIAKSALSGLGGFLGKLGIPGASAVPAIAGAKGGTQSIEIELVNNSSLPLDIANTQSSGVDKDQVISIITNNFDEGGILRSLFGGA